MGHNSKAPLSNIAFIFVAKCPLLENIKVKIKNVVIMISIKKVSILFTFTFLNYNLETYKK